MTEQPSFKSWEKGVRMLHNTQTKVVLKMKAKNVEGGALAIIDTVLQFSATQLSILAYLCSQDRNTPYEQSARTLAERFYILLLRGSTVIDEMKKEQAASVSDK